MSAVCRPLRDDLLSQSFLIQILASLISSVHDRPPFKLKTVVQNSAGLFTMSSEGGGCDRRGINTILWIVWIITTLSSLAFGVMALLVVNGLIQVRGRSCLAVEYFPAAASLMDTSFSCIKLPIWDVFSLSMRFCFAVFTRVDD